MINSKLIAEIEALRLPVHENPDFNYAADSANRMLDAALALIRQHESAGVELGHFWAWWQRNRSMETREADRMIVGYFERYVNEQQGIAIRDLYPSDIDEYFTKLRTPEQPQVGKDAPCKLNCKGLGLRFGTSAPPCPECAKLPKLKPAPARPDKAEVVERVAYAIGNADAAYHSYTPPAEFGGEYLAKLRLLATAAFAAITPLNAQPASGLREMDKRLKTAIGGLRSIAYGHVTTWPEESPREVAKQALRDCGGEKHPDTDLRTKGAGA